MRAVRSMATASVQNDKMTGTPGEHTWLPADDRGRVFHPGPGLLGAAARRRVEAAFSAETMAFRIEAAYRDIVSR